MSSNRVETRKAQISAAIKSLKESSNLQEKCKALSCIQSIASKPGTQDVATDSQSREMCKSVLNAFVSGQKNLHTEASGALTCILQSYKDRKLNLFNELIHISFENRLKIFQLFEELQDETIAALSKDSFIVEFFKNCLSSINSGKMEWLAPNSCSDNIKALQIAESQTMTPAEQVEERMTICILELLHRLYGLSKSPSYADYAKFGTLFVDKIATLAYMGHKRQRGSAIKLLRLPNMGNHIRSNFAPIWQTYKTTLQNTYCQRMAVLVTACDPDWASLWTTSIQLLGTDLHRGAGLINNLLSVEEKAFKSIDTVVRKQAFLSWKLIVDNFALDEQELATARRVKLLCIPLNAKNSKTESMTLTKLEVWWHLIYKLYNHIAKFTNPVLTQFLNFCFGPLGDTPLLSSKFNVIASPGKRFSKTKLVAIDALLQLLSDNKDDLKIVQSSLEEKIPGAVSSEVFYECFKPFTHSVGEACLALAQLTPKETDTRCQVIEILWRTLLTRVKNIKDEAAKVQMYKEIMLLVLELSEHSETKSIIGESMVEIILPSLDEFPANYIFHLETIVGLMTVLTKPAVLNKISKKHHELIKRLLLRGVKPPEVTSSYVQNALEVFKKLVDRLDAVKLDDVNIGASVLWNVLCEMISKYMIDGNKMNEGDALRHDFTTVTNLIKFPFSERFAPDFWEYKSSTVDWKALYKQLDRQANLVPTVKRNEYVFFTVGVIQNGIALEKRCAGFAVTCLDEILITMNYNHMLGENRFLPILKLMNDLCILNLVDNKYKDAEAALRGLSSVLITLYGTAPDIIVSCLEVVHPAIEEMLKPYDEEGLVREITSTWETIMMIFKGVGVLSSPELIVSFEAVMKLALHHHEPEIVSQTLACLKTEECMTGPTKDVVQTLLKESNTKKNTKESNNIKEMPDNVQKQTKPMKLVGSFLNRKTNGSPKPVTPTQKQTDGTKSPFFPDPESQEYVVIQSEFKFDANRLTEHQKESLLRRREDIPALYNDLSQSCSQDTQNIQEWFDKKKKEIAKTNIDRVLTASTALPNTENIEIREANKENKLECVKTSSGSKDNENLDKVNETKKVSGNKKLEKVSTTSKEKSLGNSSTDQIFSPIVEIDDKLDSDKLVATKLDFESRTEFPDDDSSVQQSLQAPSTSKKVEILDQKLKKIGKGYKGESETIQEPKRGVKRKSIAVSDSDSEGNVPPSRRRRKSNPALVVTETQSDSDSVKSTESEEATKHLSKRTKNEMSRLQINMVFDNKQFSTLPSRRRSKIHPDEETDTANNEPDHSETSKLTRNRLSRIVPQESTKLSRVVKTTEKEKETKNITTVNIGKKRGRKPRNAIKDEQPVENTLTVDSPRTDDHSNVNSTEPKKSKLKARESPEAKEKKEMIELREEIVTKDKNEADNSSEQLTTSQNFDTEEIVESSQASSVVWINSEKKYNNKQCFIRINKIKSIQPGQLVETDGGKDLKKMSKATKPDSPPVKAAKIPVRERESDDDPMMGKPVKEAEPTPPSAVSIAEPEQMKSDVSLSRTPQVVTEELPVIITEMSTSSPEARPPIPEVSSSPIRLPITALNSSSPKNSLKRYSKLKSVTTQGRTAHMLGLVTKQAIAETMSNNFSEAENLPSKSKTKEIDEECSTGKKEKILAFKEPERLGSPSGSRQEKIFNRMKISTDGIEKDLFVPASILMTAQIDKTTEKNNEDNTSPIHEREPLPMLEWSSANPPSLTASPSASILKRQRIIQTENDPESPSTCKRKRVSFADPPVSKEMGYEIPASTPTHRMSKVSVSRIFLSRKDTPVRLKQTKLKLVQSSPGKSDKETEIETEKVVIINDTECQSIQTADDVDTETAILPDSDTSVIIISETQNQSENSTIHDKTETISCGNDSAKIMIDNLTTEIEIAPRSMAPNIKLNEKDDKELRATTNKPKIDESETQQDIFENISVEERNSISSKNNSKRSPKSGGKDSSPVTLNTSTNNVSTEDNSLARNSQSSIETLEDTVDVQNVTGLNCTSNSDELFCSRPVRTSTQSTEADTLTVTDSVFSNLPFSQNSQATNDTMELDQPELLDSTRSIFPSLADSSVPINSVIGYLADPLWKPHLSSYLHSKGIETVGNLAQLTEREVNWIPVKRSPKVPFVKNVLQHFEKTIPSLPSTTSTVDAGRESVTMTPNASINSFPPSSTPIAQSSSLCNLQEKTQDCRRLINESMKSQSTETQVSVEDLIDEIDCLVVLKSAIKRCSAENILSHYKLKMKNMAEEDLERETIKMLGIELRNQRDLKSACRASGLTKVLGRLPDIFSHDKEFFSKVLTTYRNKIQVADCMKGLDFEELKKAVCRQCTSSSLAEMLSKKLKEEEELGIITPMTELSTLQSILKRMPKDLVISQTVANEEIISPLILLDIAIQNNTPGDISSALESQPGNVKNQVVKNLCTTDALSTQIKKIHLSDDELIDMLKSISRKLHTPKLLDAFNVIIKDKFVDKKSQGSKKT